MLIDALHTTGVYQIVPHLLSSQVSPCLQQHHYECISRQSLCRNSVVQQGRRRRAELTCLVVAMFVVEHPDGVQNGVVAVNNVYFMFCRQVFHI